MPRRLGRDDLRIDMLELRVAIGIARGLERIAIELARVFELLAEQLGDRVGADVVATLHERRSELGGALQHPPERTHGIAHRRGLSETLKIRHRRRIALAQRLAASALATHTAPGQRTGLQIALAAIDRRAGEGGDLRHDLQCAIPGRLHLVGSKQSLPPLVELAAQRFPAQSDALAVDHPTARTTVRAAPGIPRVDPFAARITIQLSLKASLAGELVVFL